MAVSLAYYPSGRAIASSTTSHATSVSTTSTSELVAIKAARWSSNVQVTFPSTGSWTFSSNGLPDATLPTYYAVPDFVGTAVPTAATSKVVTSASLEQSRKDSYTLPTAPQYTAKTTTTALGPIGVTVNGAVFFNAYEANSSTVALASNFTLTQDGHTGSFVDRCNGHFTPEPSAIYHYHGLPSCIVHHIATGKAASSPALLGFAFDGFGIYDDVAEGGHVVKPSQLDACNGIFSPVPGYPHGVYHYVMLDVRTSRSSIGCFHGIVSSAYTAALRSELSPGRVGRAERGGTASTTGAVTSATARALAADPVTDAILIAELKATGIESWCS
jgi:hypothetical protein